MTIPYLLTRTPLCVQLPTVVMDPVIITDVTNLPIGYDGTIDVQNITPDELGVYILTLTATVDGVTATHDI